MRELVLLMNPNHDKMFDWNSLYLLETSLSALLSIDLLSSVPLYPFIFLLGVIIILLF